MKQRNGASIPPPERGPWWQSDNGQNQSGCMHTQLAVSQVGCYQHHIVAQRVHWFNWGGTQAHIGGKTKWNTGTNSWLSITPKTASLPATPPPCTQDCWLRGSNNNLTRRTLQKGALLGEWALRKQMARGFTLISVQRQTVQQSYMEF